MADEREQTGEQQSPPPSGAPQRSGLDIDPKELEGLTPAQRAALYKQRQRAAGVGAPPQGATGQEPAQPAAPESAPPAAPPQAAPAAGAPAVDPKGLEGLSPAERAALYKQRQREAGFVPPKREPGAEPAAPATKPAAERPAPAAAEKPAAAAAKPAAGAKPAPKPAEPEPDPEEVKRLRELVPDLTWERNHGYAEVTIPAEKLLACASFARDTLGLDYLSSVTAVDYQDHYLLIYHLYAYDYVARPGCLALQVKLPRVAWPTIDSLTRIWPGADYQEREVWDLMGIRFLGHPDLRRVLLADDFPGHPLRKDFVFDYEYVLVPHLRSGVEGQLDEPYVPPHERVARSSQEASVSPQEKTR